ncbi:DUF2642 domain-containing protein [Bacillus megaterium]|jgi:hypothetical protein|uniref:DUF2642 domain-containing protein n=1 Tax=Priestia megaterium TaxID=1404 RepID=UPI00138EDDE0|nr:DUF2642 domain-containing protein [Priestia megaterium]
MILLALSSEARTQLLRRLLQLTQSQTTPTSTELLGLNLDVLGRDLLNLDLSLPITLPGRGSSTPSTPTNLQEYLLTLLNEQVQISTPFDTLTGTLMAVQNDYVVLVESTGSLVFVAISQIETVTEL